jgi:D-alanine-D-alanine ligase-like ATP-grasp enzyme
VDIIYNRQRNQHYVLEVNTRPGLTGTTLTRYVAAIINSFNLEKK